VSVAQRVTEDREALEVLSALLYQQRKIRLFDYKDRWFLRRLQMRMRATHCTCIPEYIDWIRHHPSEVDKLLEALAINISSFFRNREVFDGIEAHIFEDWRHRIESGEKVLFRAWSCSCAQGEEPYSLSMAWELWRRKNFRQMKIQPDLKIMANDIDTDAITKAKAATYSKKETKSLSEAELSFMEPRGEEFVVKEEIRRRVQFIVENSLMPAKKPRMDLVLCRNFLIFLDLEQQEKMMEIFADALAPGGYLVLGRVETLVGTGRTHFQAVNSTNRIYQKSASGVKLK
jgi:chemotaxis protein methyltransferase CheR